MTPADHELVALARDHDDPDAFGELVLRHQSSVRRFLRAWTGHDPAQADDLAQEAFIEAWRGLGRFRGESTFSTWILGIALNRARNARRRFRAEPVAEIPDRPDEGAASPARAAELSQDLAGALDRLSSEERSALHLCYQRGLPHSEIAAVLGWPVGTVKTSLLRSKDKLRSLLIRP